MKEEEQGRVKHVWPEGHERLGYGRGILAGDCVLFPSRDKIYKFDAKTAQPRKVIDLIPPGLTGGNLLVAGGRLLIASGIELVALGGNAIKTRSHAPRGNELGDAPRPVRHAYR